MTKSSVERLLTIAFAHQIVVPEYVRITISAINILSNYQLFL